MNKKYIYITVVIFSFATIQLFGNSYTGSSSDEAFILRAPIWVFIEPEPGYFSEKNRAEFVPPKEAIIDLSRFVLSGMAHGWKFSYTPYDKKKQVKEFFVIEPIFSIDKKDKSVKISEVEVKYPYCYCWAEYRLPKSYKTRYDFWKKNYHKTIKGRGQGNKDQELAGVYEAYTDAIKNAIRNYGRKIIKNKPKEINGEVLIKSKPRLYIESGYFKAEVVLYIKVNEIIPYKIY